jgi:DNA-binding transcriptional LysR family regulator
MSGNLRSIDLNLLVFFDALMAERHVTRAANKVALSQSAMSNALSRLRHVFKDELFVRTSRGMEPTPRAVELGEAVRHIVQQSARLLSSDVSFDPGASDRQFRTRMSDLVGYLLLPPLMQKMQAAAPGISLDLLHMSPEKTVEALEADELDLAVSMELEHPKTIHSEPLFGDRMVCLMREGHPMARGRMTLRKFLAARHLRVSMSPTDIRFVDNVLADRGERRDVVLNVPHWLLVPRILLQSDLMSVISERVASRFAPEGLVLRPLPFPSDTFLWAMYWHRRYERSRAHAWMRGQVKSVCESL